MFRKKQIFEKLESSIVNSNECKYLRGRRKQAFQFEIRDRREETSYYLVSMKGNYIRGYKINYINQSEKSINTFMDLFIPALVSREITSHVTITKKVLIAKKLFKEWKQFFFDFKESSESLDWQEDWVDKYVKKYNIVTNA